MEAGVFACHTGAVRKASTVLRCTRELMACLIISSSSAWDAFLWEFFGFRDSLSFCDTHVCTHISYTSRGTGLVQAELRGDWYTHNIFFSSSPSYRGGYDNLDISITTVDSSAIAFILKKNLEGLVANISKGSAGYIFFLSRHYIYSVSMADLVVIVRSSVPKSSREANSGRERAADHVRYMQGPLR